MEKLNGLIYDTSFTFNNADTGVLIALAAFILIGLLFGAKKTGARIVLDVISGFAGIFLANLTLPYLATMDWYLKVVAFFQGNSTLVNWIAQILLSCIYGAILFFILKLIFFHLIDDMKESPVLSRIIGMLIGAADWLILLLTVGFLVSAIPGWLGTNTPSWISDANTYLGQSVILGKLMELYNVVLKSLGIAGV